MIYAHGGYYAVFGLMFAMLGIDAFLRLVMIERKDAQQWLPYDELQSGPDDARDKSNYLNIVASCPQSPGTSRTADGAGDARPIETTSCGQRSKYRLPPRLRLILSSRMLVGLAGGFLQSSLNVAFDSTLPLIVNMLFGWQQTGQGLIFIAILLPSLLQPVFGGLTDTHGQGRRLLAAGGCLLATPAFILLRLVTDNTLEQKALLCALLVVIGLAMAIAMPAIIAEIGATVADAEKNDPEAIKGSVIATGWSLVNAAYAAGCLIGPLFAGFILNAAGWQTMTWCLGLLSASTGLFLLLCLGGWVGKLKRMDFVPRWLSGEP